MGFEAAILAILSHFVAPGVAPFPEGNILAVRTSSIVGEGCPAQPHFPSLQSIATRYKLRFDSSMLFLRFFCTAVNGVLLLQR